MKCPIILVFLQFYSSTEQHQQSLTQALSPSIRDACIKLEVQAHPPILGKDKDRKQVNTEITICQTLSSIHILPHSQINKIISQHDTCMKKKHNSIMTESEKKGATLHRKVREGPSKEVTFELRLHR